MSNKLVYLDLETTGVDPQKHTITEIGLIHPTWGAKEIWVVLTPEEIRAADINSLRITRYNQIRSQRDNAGFRKLSMKGMEFTSSVITDSYARLAIASTLAEELDGKILTGCNVKFDQEFLERWLRRYDVVPTWDYHVLDVPTYAAGIWNAKKRHISVGTSLGLIPPPFQTSKLSRAFGVPEPEDAHTALGDAYWGKLLYEAAQREV